MSARFMFYQHLCVRKLTLISESRGRPRQNGVIQKFSVEVGRNNFALETRAGQQPVRLYYVAQCFSLDVCLSALKGNNDSRCCALFYGKSSALCHRLEKADRKRETATFYGQQQTQRSRVYGFLTQLQLIRVLLILFPMRSL